jgi:hypothetical protein
MRDHMPTGEVGRGGEGDKSHDGEKAWSSIYRSIFSVSSESDIDIALRRMNIFQEVHTLILPLVKLHHLLTHRFRPNLT